MILTDSIPLPPAKRISKIKTFSIAPLIGEAIRRIHRGESVGALFSSDVALTQQMLMWDDGIARTLDLSDDLPEDEDDDDDAGGRDRPRLPGGRNGGSMTSSSTGPTARAVSRSERPSPRTGAHSSARRAGARRCTAAACPSWPTRR